MQEFSYVAHPARVVFGSGTLCNVDGELARLGATRALILSTPQQHDQAEALTIRSDRLSAGVFAGAVMHTPVEVTQQALHMVRNADADALVSLGGGSTIGLGKALAVRTGLPHVAIPSTYAGSEMTPILGETLDGRKSTRTDPAILPTAVIYDVDLTLELPVAMSVTSGFNAIAHAIEALYTRDRNPVIGLIALEGIAAMTRALPLIVANPTDLAARRDAFYAAWLCGICLGSVGMALHHKLCHTLGGSFDLPHAETHTVVLPYALAYNAPVIGDVLAALEPILGSAPALRLQTIARELGAPTSLRELGMPHDGIDRAALIASTSTYWNPRQADRASLRSLLAAAWSGAPVGEETLA